MGLLSSILPPGGVATLTGAQTVSNKTLQNTQFDGTAIFKASSATEGGELTLEKGSSSTLNGGVTIDVINNVLRLFESGGTNRGALLPILSCTAGAASQLVLHDAAQTLTNKTVNGGVFGGVVDQTGSVRGGIDSTASATLDCSATNYFIRTVNGATTFVFSNPPASRAYSMVLEVIHTSGAITWPASVRWPGGTAPTLTTGRVHLFVFVTDDGGTTWRASALANYTS